VRPEEVKKFAGLLRDYCRLQAEVRALAAILETAVTLNVPPVGWLDRLMEMRQTLEYRSIAEQYEPQIRQGEQAADDALLNNVVRTIPRVGFLP
jgi:hypothetical protein